MRRFCQTARVSSAVSVRCIDAITKANPFMKHLDVYARRDPQLAPYLLREVDIEYKRKCYKASFCWWLAFAVSVMLFQSQLQAEQVEVLITFADMVRREQEARDEDFSARRRLFGKYLSVIKSAFSRDQTWTASDTAKVKELFETSAKEASST